MLDSDDGPPVAGASVAGGVTRGFGFDVSASTLPTTTWTDAVSGVVSLDWIVATLTSGAASWYAPTSMVAWYDSVSSEETVGAVQVRVLVPGS